MTANLVHTYVTGNYFPNIYGGETACMYGSITHIKHLTPLMKQRWPWMQNQWSLSDHKFTYGYFKTLQEAKRRAEELWPNCGFKTPEQFREEDTND